MLKLTSRIALSAALLGAVLIGAATSDPGGASPIVNGHGSWETPIGTVSFQVSVVERPDGTLVGNGVSTLQNDDGVSWFHFDVTETLQFGDELAVAGLITQTHNAPPQFLGSLTVLLIQDNGSGDGPPDKAISASGLPTFLTLEQIVNTPPEQGGPPPSELWFPLGGGNFVVH